LPIFHVGTSIAILTLQQSHCYKYRSMRDMSNTQLKKYYI